MRSITIFCLLSAVCAVALGQWEEELRRFRQVIGFNANGGAQPGGSVPSSFNGRFRQVFDMFNPSGNRAQDQPGASKQGQTQGQEQGRLGSGILGQMMDGIRNGGSQRGAGPDETRLGSMMGQVDNRLRSSGNGGQRLPWGSQRGETQGQEQGWLGRGLSGQMDHLLTGVNDQLQSSQWSSWLPQNNNIRNQHQQTGQQPSVDNNANAERQERPANTQNITPAQ